MITIRTRGNLSLRLRPRAVAVGVVCVLLALALSVFAIGSGDYPMSTADVLRALTGRGDPAEEFIVTELRLPRVVTALCVGAALALAGAVFQSLVRNPLGSPDMLGFTQGAATGALVVVVLGGSSLALASSAVLGGLVTGALVYALSWRRGVHGYRLILIGIGTMAILTGVNGWLLTRAPLMDAARAVLWLTGSLDGRGWVNALPVLIALAVLVPLMLAAYGPALRLVEMGDDTASALGVRVERLRLVVLAVAVLLVSLAAAAAGPVNFVALTAPHLARRLTRAPGPNLLPSAAVGAVLLVAADQLALRAFPGHQLPVGVVTGVLGGAYLIWLLATERRAGRL
ncbi:FecCD family ABC transporter permease [Micromonospora sp. CPCC 205561]|uniref:FecCD family ABC transporter permease n=1 Tax=Micromonospora sp. CPCC 205561 TaxID=3122407 RepID=UPI002FF1F0DF